MTTFFTGEKPKPLPFIRFRSTKGKEPELILRTNLPKPDEVIWNARNRALFKAALVGKLLSPEEFKTLYPDAPNLDQQPAGVRSPEKGNKQPLEWPQLEVPHTGVFEVGGLCLDLDNKIFKLEGRQVKLSRAHLVLMALFLSQMGKALAREQILQSLIAEQASASTTKIDTVDVMISKLRKQVLGKYGGYIVPVRTVGYKFEI